MGRVRAGQEFAELAFWGVRFTSGPKPAIQNPPTTRTTMALRAFGQEVDVNSMHGTGDASLKIHEKAGNR